MRKGLQVLGVLCLAFLFATCGGQEDDFNGRMIEGAGYKTPSDAGTPLDLNDSTHTPRLGVSSLITVPYQQHDIAIPHPAYNGHPTTFKAISRGGCDTVYFRWDIDGNGTWDDCMDRTKTPNGWYQAPSRYDLGCRAQLPYVDPAQTRKLFIATIEAACTVNVSGIPTDPRFASYKVMVYADVPPGGLFPVSSPSPGTTYAYNARPPVTDTTCNTGTQKCVETGSPCWSNAYCVGDTPETLKIKREVAIDDALWYLHNSITNRTGEGVNTISGRIVAAYSPENDAYVDGSAAFLQALALTGHFNAYPPSTYVHGSFADVPALPVDWAALNDPRYITDPYAEDATRLINYLLTYLTTVTVTAANEENDGRTPIAGTDNLSGLRANNNSNMNLGQTLAAFVANGSPGISVQTTGLAGHSIGYVTQEIVDAACYYQQTGAAADGGFYYGGSPSTANIYWSNNTFALYEGMASAEKRFASNNLIISNACKHRVANHLLLVTATNGHGKLSNSGSYTSWFAPGWTGLRLLAAGWLGVDTLPYDSDTSFGPESGNTNAQLIDNFTLAKTMIGTDWNTPAANSNWRTGPENRFDGTGRGNVFAWVSFAKGARALNTPLSAYPGTSGDIDWLSDLSYIAINSQHKDGYLYTDAVYDHYNELSEFSNYYISVQVRTAWGIIHTLAEPLPDPVAIAVASPSTLIEGCTEGTNGQVAFSHAGSFHPNADHHIADHRWLFEVTGNAADAFNAVDWDAIGDGEYSADGKAYHTTLKDATPFYTYQYNGTYTAALQVVDDATPAATDMMLLAITVTAEAEVAPTADAKGPYVMATGEPLMLNGTMSDGNSDCSPGDTLTAEWYLNDDTVPFFTGITGTLTWDELVALYPGLPDAMPIPLVLKVTDGTGRTGESETTLTLGVEMGPTACFSATPLTVTCGGAIAFDAGCSTHPHATRSITTYEWQWDHDTDYVDQDPETFPFTTDEEGVTADHTYLAAGTHRATLRLTDDHGFYGIAQKVVTVTMTAKPTANPGSPYTIDEGQGLTLDGSGSTDPDIACGDTITTYEWDLDNDGLFDDCLGDPCVVSDAQSVAFGWHEGNTYAIALRVTDSTGQVSNTTQTTVRVESVCGNNFKALSEECDDGNVDDGDCCAADCSFETIGTLCGDGPAVCSGQDTCDGSGACLPNHFPETNLCGDDEGPCINQDRCNGDGDCHDNGFKPLNTPCDDTTVCNGAERCGDNNGICGVGTPLDCDDDKICTTDSCDPDAGCQYANNTLSCSDGDVCNGDEVCGEGICNAGTPLDCDDDNICTTDSCNPFAGCEKVNNTESCGDGDFCNGDEMCDGGSCQPGTYPCDVQFCDEAENTCVDCLADVHCDNAIYCDGTETCSLGECLAGDYPCGEQFCDEGGPSCVDCLIDGHCDDNNLCTGIETCNLGVCVDNEPLDCNDDNDCTDDYCDSLGGCTNVNDNTNSCDDTNALTENDICSEGTCAGTLMTGVCGNAIVIDALPYTATGTTTGRPNALDSYGLACVNASQPTGDIVYEMTVETGIEYQILVTPTDGGNLAVNLIGACGESEACLAATNTGGADEAEVVTYTADQTGTIFITIEGTGAYELAISTVEQPDEDTLVTDDVLPDTAVDDIVTDTVTVDEDTVLPDDIVIDDPVTDIVVVDEDAVVADEVTTDDVVLDNVVTDDVVPDDIATDDVVTDTVVTDDAMPQDHDMVMTDSDTKTDKDSVVTDDEQPDETTDETVADGDELLGDEDVVIVPDTNKPVETGCGCTMVF